MKGGATSGTGRGERVGRYRLLQILGEGGMGVVHLAADEDGRKVAIKVLRPQVAADQTAIRRLAREVDTMRRVRSPNVAEILDADVTAAQPYIVTQFVPGTTLEEAVLDGGPLSGRPLQRLAIGLAQALAAIHGAGIIHRDMKPGNVMIVDGEPVLIDFGIAQAMDATRLTATGLVIGTPGYLAPEIIEGEEAGPPSDVHAWAGTLVFAATGRPPFGSGTFESIFYKIMQNTPDVAGVPEPMLPLIRAAMARHPAERPTAVTLVQLARRIDLDATITDQTRVDRPRSALGLTPSAAAAVPLDDPEATIVDRSAPAEPPPSRQFAMPVPESRPSTATQQPKDFKGMLPPVVPPPAEPKPAPRPTRRQSTGRPYVPPPPGSRQSSPYAPAQPPGGYQPYAQPPGGHAAQGRPEPVRQQPQPGQPRPGQPPPYDPRAAAPPGQPAARGTAADTEPRRKPYGWYRLCSLATLALVLGLAEVTPVLTLLCALAGAVLLRAGDQAAKSMESKRVRRGPGAGDVIGAMVKAPFALPGSLLKTAMWAGLHLFAGIILVGVLMVANPTMTIARAVAYGTMAVLAVHFVGPGSAGPRRQMARLWATTLPRAAPAAVVTLALGVLAGLVLAFAGHSSPDLRPINFGSETQNLNDLKNGIRNRIGLG